MAKAGSQRQQPELLTTGVVGLDVLLRGGLRRTATHLVVGGPGTGKTVLAHQIGSRQVEAGGRVLYVTSLVESHERLVDQARTFSFFDPSTISHAFYYASPFPALRRGGLAAFREEVTRLVQKHGPTLLVLDGLHILRLAAREPLEYHGLLADLAVQSSLLGATTLLLSTALRRAGGTAADAAAHAADGVIRLGRVHVEMRHLRRIAITKMRGVDYLGGWHHASISANGMVVYPRVESLVAVAGASLESPRDTQVGFGIETLDAMLGGGVRSGTVTLLPGSPGVGKTLLGLSFLVAGAERSENGLYVGFHELPVRLIDSASRIGLPLERAVRNGAVRLEWRAPSEMIADQLAHDILAIVDEAGARRLVIDGVSELRRAVQPPERDLAFLSAFADLLRARGVSTIWTQDMPQVVSPDLTLPMPEISPEIDNVIVARHVEIRSRLHHLISVVKVRGTAPDSAIREFTVGEEGIRVGEPFDKADRLLTGMPHVAR